MKFRKGDIVGRLSYNKDIVFTVSNIIKCRNQDIAILKGLVTRIEADSPLDDLELIDNNRVINLLDSFEKELEKSKKNLVNVQNNMFKRYYQHYGRILHLDGDRKYSEKSQKVYKSMGLNVIVKNIPESKQPQMIWGLLGKYNPDILVGMAERQRTMVHGWMSIMKNIQTAASDCRSMAVRESLPIREEIQSVKITARHIRQDTTNIWLIC